MLEDWKEEDCLDDCMEDDCCWKEDFCSWLLPNVSASSWKVPSCLVELAWLCWAAWEKLMPPLFSWQRIVVLISIILVR